MGRQPCRGGKERAATLLRLPPVILTNDVKFNAGGADDDVPEIAKLQEQVHTLFVNDERHDKELKALRQDIAACNEAVLGEIKDLRREMANRLPLWATALMSILTAVVGGLIGKGGF